MSEGLSDSVSECWSSRDSTALETTLNIRPCTECCPTVVKVRCRLARGKQRQEDSDVSSEEVAVRTARERRRDTNEGELDCRTLMYTATLPP